MGARRLEDEEGYLNEEVEKNQQAQQLGCIAESDVDAYFEDGSAFPGAIDMRSKALEKGFSEEERVKAVEERMAGLETGRPAGGVRRAPASRQMRRTRRRRTRRRRRGSQRARGRPMPCVTSAGAG